MDELDKKLNRLVGAARGSEREKSTGAPFGFATRVVAQAFAEPAQTILRVWESLSWRFFGAACAVMLAAALFSPTAVVDASAAGSETEILLELADDTFEMALFP
jgi:hypothetical protein